MDDNEDEVLDPDIRLLLGDPSMWLEPSDQLENRVAAGIAEERRVVVPIGRARRVWRRQLVAAAIGAAAAAAIVLIAVPRNDSQKADARIDVLGTGLEPDANGRADITSVESGVRIDFSVKGLPRREGEDFYEGWLKNCAGTSLVPIGTYHDLDDATGWAGVDVKDFPVLTVTREHVAPPKDAAQGSSGEVVATGSLAACSA
jgi:hypothetical protein